MSRVIWNWDLYFEIELALILDLFAAPFPKKTSSKSSEHGKFIGHIYSWEIKHCEVRQINQIWQIKKERDFNFIFESLNDPWKIYDCNFLFTIDTNDIYYSLELDSWVISFAGWSKYINWCMNIKSRVLVFQQELIFKGWMVLKAGIWWVWYRFGFEGKNCSSFSLLIFLWILGASGIGLENDCADISNISRCVFVWGTSCFSPCPSNLKLQPAPSQLIHSHGNSLRMQHFKLRLLLRSCLLDYRPQTKLRKDNVFTRVCHSVHGGGVHHPGRHPPP